MKNNIDNLLNKQINSRLEIAYQYLEFSNFFDSNKLDDHARKFRAKAKEEINQAMLIYNFMKRLNISVKFLVIKQPNIDYKNVLDIYKTCIRLQLEVMTNLKYLLKQNSSDYVYKVFLEWLIDKQKAKLSEIREMIIEYSLHKDNLSTLNENYKQSEQRRTSEVLSM